MQAQRGRIAGRRISEARRGDADPQRFAVTIDDREENGAQSWNRTSDTAIFSRMLYQLSYLGAGDAEAASLLVGAV